MLVTLIQLKHLFCGIFHVTWPNHVSCDSKNYRPQKAAAISLFTYPRFSGLKASKAGQNIF